MIVFLNKRNKVVSLFDYSTIMVQPWLEAGYDCWCIDIMHNTESNSNLHLIKHDLRIPWVPPFISAFPPCDHLAVSGSAWFKGKGLRKLAEGIELFATATEFCENTSAPYMIENPVSTISTYWRKPDHIFDPWEYTRWNLYDNYTKRTCLWVGNGFIMPPKNHNPVLGKPSNWLGEKGQGEDRAMERARTPLGFAKAVFNSQEK